MIGRYCLRTMATAPRLAQEAPQAAPKCWGSIKLSCNRLFTNSLKRWRVSLWDLRRPAAPKSLSCHRRGGSGRGAGALTWNFRWAHHTGSSDAEAHHWRPSDRQRPVDDLWRLRPCAEATHIHSHTEAAREGARQEIARKGP